MARKLAALLQSAAGAYLAHPPHFLPGAALSFLHLISFRLSPRLIFWILRSRLRSQSPVQDRATARSMGPGLHLCYNYHFLLRLLIQDCENCAFITQSGVLCRVSTLLHLPSAG